MPNLRHYSVLALAIAVLLVASSMVLAEPPSDSCIPYLQPGDTKKAWSVGAPSSQIGSSGLRLGADNSLDLRLLAPQLQAAFVRKGHRRRHALHVRAEWDLGGA